MIRLLEKNGFVRVPKRGKEVKAIYRCPESDVFVTIFEDGRWTVSGAGDIDTSSMEYWLSQLSEYQKSKDCL
ncbi:MAG: hypothetical protein DRO99_03905 [Candidatus Aenigmatarchaeota archaeon]|nr:MAG: hypothetical protein DRO99_03905 [Candidatus Aenigmarchaeota archaeon]